MHWHLSRLALAAALALAAGPAGALDIGDVDLLSFPTGVPASERNHGFTNAGPGFDFATNPMTERICAGAAPFVSGSSSACQGTGYDITITQNLQTVHQFPQARGAEPTDGSPFIADSVWTATNTSGNAYPQVLLLFTEVNLLPYPGAIAPNGYPDLEVGLDGNLLDIVKFTANGMDYFFGAVDLGMLAPGESREFRVRYIVSSGAMPIVSNQVVMPPLKLVAQVVPEPGTLALLLSGLAGIAVAGRPR
jgi:hypothetical protein